MRLALLPALLVLSVSAFPQDRHGEVIESPIFEVYTELAIPHFEKIADRRTAWLEPNSLQKLRNSSAEFERLKAMAGVLAYDLRCEFKNQGRSPSGTEIHDRLITLYKQEFPDLPRHFYTQARSAVKKRGLI